MKKLKSILYNIRSVFLKGGPEKPSESEQSYKEVISEGLKDAEAVSVTGLEDLTKENIKEKAINPLQEEFEEKNGEICKEAGLDAGIVFQILSKHITGEFLSSHSLADIVELRIEPTFRRNRFDGFNMTVVDSDGEEIFRPLMSNNVLATLYEQSPKKEELLAQQRGEILLEEEESAEKASESPEERWARYKKIGEESIEKGYAAIEEWQELSKSLNQNDEKTLEDVIARIKENEQEAWSIVDELIALLDQFEGAEKERLIAEIDNFRKQLENMGSDVNEIIGTGTEIALEAADEAERIQKLKKEFNEVRKYAFIAHKLRDFEEIDYFKRNPDKSASKLYKEVGRSSEYQDLSDELSDLFIKPEMQSEEEMNYPSEENMEKILEEWNKKVAAMEGGYGEDVFSNEYFLFLDKFNKDVLASDDYEKENAKIAKLRKVNRRLNKLVDSHQENPTKGITREEAKEIYEIAKRKIGYGAEEQWEMVAMQSINEYRGDHTLEAEEIRLAQKEEKEAAIIAEKEKELKKETTTVTENPEEEEEDFWDEDDMEK